MRLFRSRVATALVSAALLSTAALAQDAASNPFDALDADHDGMLNAQEGQQHPVVASSFTAADKNGDGKLSREEFNAAFKTRQQSAPSEAAPPEAAPGGQTPPPQSPPQQ